MRHEDLPAVDDLGQRNRLVVLPLLHDRRALDVDNEVVFLALEVDLGKLCSALHGDS